MEKVIVKTLDDLTGEEGASPVEFGIDGDIFEIDLTGDNAQRLRDVFEDYVRAGRRLGKGAAKATQITGRGSAPKTAPVMDREQMAAMREWAKRNGIPISPRGRIREIVRTAYHENNPEIARIGADNSAPVAAG